MGIYFVNIAGESKPNSDGSSRQAIIARCAEGERVTLVREPDNPFDPCAIRVESAHGCIGYVAADKAEWMHEIIDEGRPIAAEIKSIGSSGRMLGVVLTVATGKDCVAGAEIAPVPSAPDDSEAVDPAVQAGQKAGTGCGIVALAALVIVLLVMAMDGSGSQEDLAEKAADRAKGFHCLSGWDGSHPGFVTMVKDQLRDPGSFEHIETRITPANPQGQHVLVMQFRSRNGFGGMTGGTARALVDHQTCRATLTGISG